MKIQNKKTNTGLRYTILAAALLLTASVAYLYYGTNTFRDSTPTESEVDMGAPTDAQSEAGENQAEQQDSSDIPDDTDQNTPNEQQPEQKSPDSTSSTSVGDLTITVASHDGNSLMIRTLIRGVTPGGTCELTLRQDGAVKHKESVKTQIVARNYTCMGFDVNTGSLAKGSYEAVVDYTNGQQKLSARQSVSIQ